MEIFLELALLIFIVTLISFLMRILRQPLIVGYILTGILAGPYFLNVLQSIEVIEVFSKFGITILLFIVGLSLNPIVIREVGRVSLVTGVGQVIFTSLIGFALAIALGLDRIAAIYTAIALTFSSTIIILKLLSDKGDLHRLYGKIAVGFLIVQDIIATIILILVATLKGANGTDMFTLVTQTLLKGGFLILGLILVGRFILPQIARYAAKSQELLFLFALSWGLGLSALFHVLGFSIEIGALVAGVAFASTPYAYEIGSRVKPLRDFFILLFFILLGSRMMIGEIGELLIPGIVLSAFVLIGNPLIVIILMNLLGYGRRVGFLAGLTVAQISEFSLILAALGQEVGHLSDKIVSLITLVGLITIAGSTYLIIYSDKIYRRISGVLKFLELRPAKQAGDSGENRRFHMALFGYDRVGRYIVGAFSRMQRDYIIIDYNPDNLTQLADQSIPTLYGDAEDPNLIDEINIDTIKLVVSTIPEFRTNMQLVTQIKKRNPNAIIITVAHNTKEALHLYKSGATYVIIPHHLGNVYVSRMISRLGFERRAYQKERMEHVDDLEGLLDKAI